jgi:Arc/MetJ-type ribon-helix-helix transcriptional regulator
MGKENAVETEMLNIRLPEDIIRWLDSLVESGIYSSRSEAIRDFLRDFVLQSDGESTGK